MRPEFILAIASILGKEYGSEVDFDSEYAFDEEVSDCLMHMYVYMMSGDDEIFNEFHELYQRLDPKKQAYVKKDYLSIIESQEKQKVREREDNIYE